MCPSTKSPEHMATMKLPYACKLLFQELQVRPLRGQELREEQRERGRERSPSLL